MAKDALLIVAHPDDDILFAGHLQRQWKHLNWSVLCVVSHDPVREEEMRKYQASLGVEDVEFLFYKDEQDNPFIGLHDKIKAHIQDVNPRMVVSHNHLGEYGHIHHIEVYDAVMQATESTPIPFLMFGWGMKFFDMQLMGPNKDKTIKQYYKSQTWITEAFFASTIETFVWAMK